MLYMVMDVRDNKTLIKVGQTKKIETRLNAYRTHNPLAKIVSTLDNMDPTYEKYCERLCKKEFLDLGYKQIGGTERFILPKGETKAWRKSGFKLFTLINEDFIGDNAICFIGKIDNQTGKNAEKGLAKGRV